MIGIGTRLKNMECEMGDEEVMAVDMEAAVGRTSEGTLLYACEAEASRHALGVFIDVIVAMLTICGKVLYIVW